MKKLKPGDLVAGKYRIQRQLGQGGMGVVYAATDVALNRAVALKHLLPSLGDDEVSVARFAREARAAVCLTSEHSARVYDIGELPGGVPFMVMEYLSGKDLGAVLASAERLSFDKAVDYVLQATEAVAEAHAAGIVHRDLKPQNLFLTTRPDGGELVKVLDFGLAKTSGWRGEGRLTGNADVMGSPAYMSPEQIRGSRDVDARADVWSLGVCLYELVTGQVPFEAPNASDILVKVLTESPTAPHRHFADIPFGLSQIIMRCLEKNAPDRFRDVGELAARLQEFGSLSADGASDRVFRVLTKPRAPMISDGPVEGTPENDNTKTEAIVDSDTTSKERRLAWMVALGALLATSIAATLILYGTRPSSSSPDRDAPNASAKLSVNPEAPTEPAPPPPALADTTDPTDVKEADSGGNRGSETQTSPSTSPKQRPPRHRSPPAQPRSSGKLPEGHY